MRWRMIPGCEQLVQYGVDNLGIFSGYAVWFFLIYHAFE